jgi:hypothetical protein
MRRATIMDDDAERDMRLRNIKRLKVRWIRVDFGYATDAARPPGDAAYDSFGLML